MTLKFGIPIAKRSFNGKSMSSNLEFIPVANKVGQRVKKFILSIFFFRKIQQMIDKGGNKFLF